MLISITGPSGVGKGYIKERLITNISGLCELTWMTTRPLRPNEISGSSNRLCVNRDEFEKLVVEGKMLFCQELFGNLYGIRSEDVCHSGEGIRITEFHIDNVVLARKSGIQFFGIAIVPQDIELLSGRLRARNTENGKEIEERIGKARDEIQMIMANPSLFDLFITVTESNEGQIVQEIIFKLINLLERRM